MGPGVVEFGTEEANRPSAMQSIDGQAMEARFADLCKSCLELDDGTVEEAVALFGESKKILLGMSPIGSGSPMMVEKCWSAFLLYCVARLCTVKDKREKEGRIKLSQILQATKLNAMDFFTEVSHFSLKADTLLSSHYGSNWEEMLKLKELQSDVEQLCCLSRFYKRAYHQLFKASDRCSGRQLVSNDGDYVSDYHHFGWLLFLVLRAHALSCCQDLVTCTYALVSVLAILILHVPTSLRKFSISDFPLLDKKSDKGVDLLAFLCQTYNVLEDELRRMMKIVSSVLVDVLKRKPSHALEKLSHKFIWLRHSTIADDLYFEDLLDEKSLLSHLLFLNKDYELITGKVELDERMFLNIEEHHGAFNSPKKLKTNAIAFYPAASPVKGNYICNPLVAELTPVSCTMTAAKWLREVISPFPPKPSSVLLHFLVSKDCDLLSTVTHRANIILEAIFPGHSGERCIAGGLQGANLMESAWAENRKLESIKLYYRVLETICIAESERINGNNLISLLSNERFHRCMLACSAELVLATHKTATMMFPAVLEKTGITAFDLSKVIESFVRYEETLPRELKRHLNSLEERLLESMSWEKGSSLYNSLIIARPDLSAEINKLGLLAEPMPSLDAIVLHNNIPSGRIQSVSSQVHGASLDSRSPKRLCSENRGPAEQNFLTSPIKENLITFHSPRPKFPSLQSAFASPACRNPSTGGETCAEAGICIFFSKILKLAAIRIKSLCERLGLPQQTLEHVYFLVQQILNQRTSLFFNRHIDQLILCSIYGVNKISNLDLTFKTIIYHYRKQPQCRTQVFRSVYWSSNQNLKKGQEYVDIITFYNVVFIPSVKPLLMELSSSKLERSYSIAQDKNSSNGNIPESPQLSTFPNLPDMSPKKVSAAHNVYVSPLRQSKMDALLAPSSKSYYACVGESTHAFQSPSKDLMVINNRLNGGTGRRIGGRLNFDMVSDSVVAGSLCPQNGSSASSAPGIAVDVTVKLESDS
ncbi:hypothetical protein HPP92_009582 [Vanilla planifolia]|uniref:Retinoblastoma-related protein n=1 Tax=Vanilla planifolia TaxID=51239 RepID=A0A835RK28_VANPL|nr:hypothetical protein HPP92_009582 [Vanilla planifolia]